MSWGDTVHRSRVKALRRNRKTDSENGEMRTPGTGFPYWQAGAVVIGVASLAIYIIKSHKRKPSDPRRAAANAAERRLRCAGNQVPSGSAASSSGQGSSATTRPSSRRRGR